MRNSTRLFGSLVGVLALTIVVVTLVVGGQRPAGQQTAVTPPVTVYATSQANESMPSTNQATDAANARQEGTQSAIFNLAFAAYDSNPLVIASEPVTPAANSRESVASLSLHLSSVEFSRSGMNTVTPLSTTQDLVGMDIFPSPDGSKVAIAKGLDRVSIYTLLTGSFVPLFPKGKGPQYLFLSWHQDSRQAMVLAQNGQDAGFWAVNADGSGGYTALVQYDPPDAIRDAARSPDGKQVAYSVNAGFNVPYELWTAGTDGSGASLVFTSWQSLSALTWSPDGQRIAFHGDGLEVINADGTGRRKLSSNYASAYRKRPVWSPDGRTLAFTSMAINDEALNASALRMSKILLVDITTGQEHPLLAQNNGGNFDPAWSPDGSQIAFVSLNGEATEVWVVNSNGNDPMQITHLGKYIRKPFWQQTSR